MSKTHIIVKGDTLSALARRYYGDATQYMRIFNASNFRSGDPDLIFPGEIARIPDDPKRKKVDDAKLATITPPRQAPEATDPEQVSMMIDGKLFNGWKGLQLQKSMDACADAFSFATAFDATNKALVEIFKPRSYKSCRIYVGGSRLIDGTIEKRTPGLDENGAILQIEGRSLTGILTDCPVLPPLQFKNQKLSQIASAVCKPYGISVTATADSDVLKEVVADNGQKVFDFLNEIAQKHGLFLAPGTDGNLIIQHTIKPLVIVGKIDSHASADLSISASFDDTKSFSDYIVKGQTAGKSKMKATVKDTTVGMYRPTIMNDSDAEPGNIETAGKFAKSRALAESMPLSMEWSGWRAPDGSIWQPGTAISLKSPENFIFDFYIFLVTGVTLSIDDMGTKTSSIELTIPEAYSLDFPARFPWTT